MEACFTIWKHFHKKHICSQCHFFLYIFSGALSTVGPSVGPVHCGPPCGALSTGPHTQGTHIEGPQCIGNQGYHRAPQECISPPSEGFHSGPTEVERFKSPVKQLTTLTDLTFSEEHFGSSRVPVRGCGPCRLNGSATLAGPHGFRINLELALPLLKVSYVPHTPSNA